MLYTNPSLGIESSEEMGPINIIVREYETASLGVHFGFQGN